LRSPSGTGRPFLSKDRGRNGTFTDRYTGTLGPLSSPRQIASGRRRFTGGTGAYANIHGDGTFLLVVDGTTGLATGVHDGRVRSSDHSDDDH
jgi:hypothetical protein